MDKENSLDIGTGEKHRFDFKPPERYELDVKKIKKDGKLDEILLIVLNELGIVFNHPESNLKNYEDIKEYLIKIDNK